MPSWHCPAGDRLLVQNQSRNKDGILTSTTKDWKQLCEVCKLGTFKQIVTEVVVAVMNNKTLEEKQYWPNENETSIRI